MSTLHLITASLLLIAAIIQYISIRVNNQTTSKQLRELEINYHEEMIKQIEEDQALWDEALHSRQVNDDLKTGIQHAHERITALNNDMRLLGDKFSENLAFQMIRNHQSTSNKGDNK